jgi:hypothetical protein
MKVMLSQQVDAFPRTAPVSYHITEANPFSDALVTNVLQHLAQGMDVAVNIADDRH